MSIKCLMALLFAAQCSSMSGAIISFPFQWLMAASFPADMTSNNCSRFIVTNFDEDEDENFEAYSQNNFVFYNLNIEHISILCCWFLTLQMSVFALIDTFYILVYITDQYVIQSLDFSMISNNITVFSSSSLSLLSGGDG